MTENIILAPVPDLSDLSASATWSVRYRDPSGFECVLSLESASGVEVLQKAQAALVKLSDSGCTPLHNPQVSSATNAEAKASIKVMAIGENIFPSTPLNVSKGANTRKMMIWPKMVG